VKLLIDGVHFGGQVVLAAWGSMNAAVRTHLAVDKDAPAFRFIQATGGVNLLKLIVQPETVLRRHRNGWSAMRVSFSKPGPRER
jgi:hypothetical protein